MGLLAHALRLSELTLGTPPPPSPVPLSQVQET
jgi:hypothetical protein